MKKPIIRSLAGMILIAFASASIVVSPSAAQNQGTSGGVDVRVRLLNQGKFMAGEPVLLRYEIVAPKIYSVGFEKGNWNTAWYEVVVKNKKGETIPAYKDSRPPYRGGFGPMIGRNTVPSWKPLSGEVNLSRLANFSKSGEYTLSFRIRMRYVFLPPSRELMESEDYERLREEPKIYSASIEAPFTLAEPDGSELRRQAIRLRQQVMDAPDQWKAAEIADKLFSMADTIAYPQWRQLAAQEVQPQAVAQALARTHSKKAVDLLISMAKKPCPTAAQYGEWNIPGLLRELCGVAEPDLRQYIDDAIAKNEKRFQPASIVYD